MNSPSISLIIVGGPRKGETVVFQPGSVVRIGRVMRGNNLPIKDAGISSKHLTIEFSSGKWIVRDLGSSNGTTVNDDTVNEETPVELHNGNMLKLGETTSILIKIDGGERAAEEVAVVVESQKGNPLRRGRALKSETESVNKEVENLEKKANVRVTRSRKNLDSVNHELVAPKAPEIQESNANRKRGRPPGRKRNQQEKKSEEKETDFIPKDEVVEQEEPNSSSRNEVKLGDAKNNEVEKSCNERDPEKKSEEKEAEPIERDEVNEQEELNSSPPDEEKVEDAKNEVEKSCNERDQEKKSGEKEAEPIRKDEVNEQEELNSSPPEEEKVEDANNEVKKSCDERVELEKMTLGEWFDYLEVHLPKQIIETTDEMIEGIRKKAERLQQYMVEQKKKGKARVAPG
ncbi:hypothetical protein CCACVL1_27574 [Corchorus capsularis]|uniref:FHA domain-containing protein n=1 Tax=Corchorus capsularis TaxID=210143 RepID=A0A1R3G9K7_COCAP|nr:hypothetical protein CCACVL1_27574 [Corchorus capsularis]